MRAIAGVSVPMMCGAIIAASAAPAGSAVTGAAVVTGSAAGAVTVLVVTFTVVVPGALSRARRAVRSMKPSCAGVAQPSCLV